MIKHELLESPEAAYDLYYVGDAMTSVKSDRNYVYEVCQ